MSGFEDRSDGLHERVQLEIAGSVGDRRWQWPDPVFEDLAAQLFAHQYGGSEAYRRYCDGRGCSPREVSSWLDIPAVPTDVFRSVNLCTFPAGEAAGIFETSGTTSGNRGRHYLRRCDTYAASLAPWMDTFLLPAGDLPRIVVLAPSAQQDPRSSLSFMLQWAVDHRGDRGSGFFWAEDGPQLAAAVDSMREASASGRGVLLLGTARALQALLEGFVAGDLGALLSLAPGSRLMETGGFKGAARTLSRDLFYEGLAKVLSLPPSAIVSEYGMTELASQGYQPGWLAAADPEAGHRFDGLAAALPEGTDGAGLPRIFVFPPWCRVMAVDPETLSVLPAGRRGLLRFWDLANVDSIIAVQTADLGVVRDNALVLSGRAPGAAARGCSLAVDEILAGIASDSAQEGL